MTAYGGFHHKNIYIRAAAGHSRLLQPRKESSRDYNKETGISLSNKNLFECATSEDHGCNGGLMDCAFEFILRKPEIMASPLKNLLPVRWNLQHEKGILSHFAKIVRYKDASANSESSLLEAVAK